MEFHIHRPKLGNRIRNFGLEEADFLSWFLQPRCSQQFCICQNILCLPITVSHPSRRRSACHRHCPNPPGCSQTRSCCCYASRTAHFGRSRSSSSHHCPSPPPPADPQATHSSRRYSQSHSHSCSS